MPADRARSARQADSSERDARQVLAPASSNAASASNSSNETPRFEQELHPLQRSASHRRKKAENYIPRPPNAFILFRAAFIKSRHVSSEIETNHSTLSKIIGLTWRTLPEAERLKWHEQAKLALAEHRSQFPGYSFRPVHLKGKEAPVERRKLREVGPKDQKRCAKIAELLVSGKKGHDLEAAIQEYDRTHVREVATRFDTPMTANTFNATGRETTTPPAARRKSSAASRAKNPPPADTSPASSPSPPASFPSAQDDTPASPQPVEANALQHPQPTHSFDTFTQPPSFDFDSYSFSVDGPAYPLQIPSVNFIMAPDAQPMHNFPPPQSPSHLSPITRYPTAVDDWRHGSPLSNATSSMPSTPSQLCVPFPDHYADSHTTYSPGVFQLGAGDPASNYCNGASDSAYDFTQYPSFTSVPSHPEPDYGARQGGTNGKDAAHASSSLLSPGHFHMASSSPSSEQLDFSSFVHMGALSGGDYAL